MKQPMGYAEAVERTRRIREALEEAVRLRALAPADYGKSARQPPTYTYFAMMICDDGPGPIKIGCATDVRARIALLQTGCPYPLWLMGYVHGGRDLEQQLHRKYADRRMRGEWFRWAEDLEHELYGMVWEYEDASGQKTSDFHLHVDWDAEEFAADQTPEDGLQADPTLF